VFADYCASEITLNIARDRSNIEPKLIVEGMLLAFKYIRLFYHMKIHLNHVRSLDAPNSHTSFLRSIGELPARAWGPRGADDRILRSKFRETFLRNHLRHLITESDLDLKRVEEPVSQTLREYDKNIEYPITCGLSDLILEYCDKNTWANYKQLCKQVDNKRAFVDELTGWSYAENLLG